MNNNPFSPANQVQKKLKVFVYGFSGTGKTIFGLSFPGKVAIIDLENGTDLYGGQDGVGDFDVIHTRSLAELSGALDFIERDNGETYQTVVIDPMTVMWLLLQEAVPQKYRTRDGGITIPGWGAVKRPLKKLGERLTSLPIHTVVTARAKQDMDFEGNILGIKPDMEKNFVYYFDILIRLEHSGKDRRAIVEKDRSNTLPAIIDSPSFEDLAAIVGKFDEGELIAPIADASGLSDNAAVIADSDPRTQKRTPDYPDLQHSAPTPRPQNAQTTPNDADEAHTLIDNALQVARGNKMLGSPTEWVELNVQDRKRLHATIGDTFSNDEERYTFATLIGFPASTKDMDRAQRSTFAQIASRRDAKKIVKLILDDGALFAE